MPTPPRFSSNLWILVRAVSENEIMPVTVICYCGFDGVFSKDATMDFDWWQREFLSNL